MPGEETVRWVDSTDLPGFADWLELHRSEMSEGEVHKIACWQAKFVPGTQLTRAFAFACLDELLKAMREERGGPGAALRFLP